MAKFDMKNYLDLLRPRHALDFVGVDLTAGYVRIVQVREISGRPVVESILHEKFAEGADDEIVQYLKRSWSVLGVKSRKAVCTIPAHMFISKNVDIPSKDREEISKIIDLQAGRYTPYSRDEIVIDYLCMETTGKHYTNVLLAIVNRNLVERYIRIFAMANLDIERIAVSAEGMTLAYGKMLGTEVPAGAVAGVHIGREISDLTVLDNQQMAFVRSLPIGFAEFQKSPEDAKAKFAKQLDQSIAAYQDAGVGQAIGQLVITGRVEQATELSQSLASDSQFIRESKTPVKILNYADFYTLSERARAVVNSDKEDSFFDILAPLHEVRGLTLNLLPREVKIRLRLHAGGRDIMTTGILFMTMLVLFCMSLMVKIYFKSEKLAHLEAFSKKTHEKARILEKASSKTRFMRALLTMRGKGLFAFERLSAYITPDIYLTNFKYEENGNITLSGTADSMSRVFAFVTELENSKYFTNVKTNETKTRREGGKDLADFVIACVLPQGS